MFPESDMLDDVWRFVETQISRGIKKKDIVLLLNDAGYRTQKGKLWTYQTLLLEQRRRGESRAQKKIERPIKKVAVVVQKSQRSQKSRANEGLFVKIDPILNPQTFIQVFVKR